MKKTSFLVVFSIVLFSCSNNKMELEKLTTKNDSLITAINILKQNQDNLQFQVGLMPTKSNKIKLGEDYEAVVFFIASDKTQSNELTLFDNLKNNKLKDTLVFRSEPNLLPTIKFSPVDTGKHELHGYLKSYLLGKEYNLSFVTNFEVN